MAMKRRASSFFQLVHFFVRFLGVTGAMAALAGWFIHDILDNQHIGLIVIYSGLGAMGVALLFEVRGIVGLASTKRGFASVNVLFQVVAAVALVGFANYMAFLHHKRFDLTTEQIFTLDQSIRDQLTQMRGETEIIVFQKYRSFGQRAKDEQDAKAIRARNEQEKIDLAAQKRIIEKIRDLVEQFEDLGPRFHVHNLDMKDDSYDQKLAAIKGISEELADTILAAPENSVFFYSRETKNIQRLGFSDIYQVDTQSSIEQKNLVLHYQGEKPFANKIFNIEEKKPRIALAVVHPLLGFENKEVAMYTMSGAKKFLKSYGFDAMDVMLRKIGEDGDLTDEATALTYDESRYEQIEDELAETEDAIQEQDKRLIEFAELHKFWTESSLAKLNTKYVYWFREDGRQGIALRTAMDEMRKSGVLFKFIDVDEDDRRNMTGMYDQNVNVLKHVLKMNRDERDSLLKEKATLKVENLAEKRRITDVEAKTKSMLAGVDLLVIPRITVINAPTGFAIPNRIHRLDDAHLKAMKSFLRDGKPVLFLLGPPSHPRESPDMATTDPLETMLSEIGVNLPKQTILYNIESRDFNARKFGGALGGGTKDTEVPGLKFDESTMTVAQFTKVKQTLSPHAIRSSLTLMSRTGATKDAEEVRIRHPRPVYLMKTTMEPNAAASLVGGLVSPGMAGPIFASTIWVNKASQKPDENAVFLVTREESWNENNPFITKNKAPSFTPPKDDDPKKGTVEEPRTGPFPIGIAFETAAPAAWYDADSTKPKPARIAVIGSGGAFVGTDLTPLKEKVLFDVTNWLLGRDDLLARDVETWEYPRVPMKRGSLEFHLWHWGARLGLPLAFVYLGMVVWLVRRMR